MGKLIQNKDKIIMLYSQNNSIRQIAKILDASPSGIKSILHKYNIKMRNKCESLNLCPNEFTQKEEELLIGTLLGDGHITKQKSKKSECNFSIGHSFKQKEYIKYKFDILSRFIGCKIYDSYPIIKDKKYHNLNFVTRKSPLFTKYRNIFYNKYKKFAPLDIIKNLSDYSLAIWYMDDGYHYPSKGIEFHTQSFSKKENEEILKIFKDKYGIQNYSLRRRGKKNYCMYIHKSDKNKIFDRIAEYIIPSMNYKISESSEAIRWMSLKDKDMVRTYSERVGGIA